MKIKKNKVSSPVGMIVNFLGILVFIAGMFTSVYYLVIENYVFMIWAFLGGFLFLAICSGIPEIIYQLLKLRQKLSIIQNQIDKKEKRSFI